MAMTLISVTRDEKSDNQALLQIVQILFTWRKLLEAVLMNDSAG
jgi:hypothetical protein